ncbi:MAG: alcohol dehydrogenase catalytic domain-containing protein [Phycisphaerae bacterium]|nr:alcohol dehydrogenase catalytic domain-containing protein [Phycisphaerae bacterium]
MRALVLNIKPLSWAVCKALWPVWPGAVLSSLGGLRLGEMVAPELPGDDWVRVRTRLAGLCGTDLAILAQKQRPNSILQAYSSTPLLLGHENVSEVASVGPAVDPSWVGRRVCVEPTLSCVPRGIEPLCECCRRGAFGACENFDGDGVGRYRLPPGTSIGYNARTGGAYGEQFVAHVSQLVPVSDELSDEQAVLTDPLACSLHAVLRAELQDNSPTVLVYGGGILGLGCVAALRATGFAGRIDLAARHEFQASLGRKMGASEIVLRQARTSRERFEEIAVRTGGRVREVRFGNLMLSGGYDVVFDCVGSVLSLGECVKWTAGRGKVVLVGTGHGVGVDWTPVWFRELTILGAYGRQVEHWQGRRIGTYPLVHEFMQAGTLPTDGLLTHRFALAEYREAFATALNKASQGAVRVVFDFR